jgi:hypothetical protein
VVVGCNVVAVVGPAEVVAMDVGLLVPVVSEEPPLAEESGGVTWDGGDLK